MKRRGAEVGCRLAPAAEAEEERACHAQFAAVHHWPTIRIRPSAKLPGRRSTEARNLPCSPPVAQGRSAAWHACFTALLVAASQVLRWNAATSSRHWARTQARFAQATLG